MFRSKALLLGVVLALAVVYGPVAGAQVAGNVGDGGGQRPPLPEA